MSQGQSRSQVQLLRERIRRRWWLVVLVGLIAAAGSAGAVLLDGDTYTARATLTNASPDQNRDPEAERVLTQGYADFFNLSSTQQVLRAAAGVPPEIETTARSAAGSPLLFIEAVGPDAGATEAAAEGMAAALAEDVNSGLPPGSDTGGAPDRELLRGLQLDAGVAPDGDEAGQAAFAGLVGGLLMGALFAIAVGRYERRIASAREASDRLGIDVLAVAGGGPDRREMLRALLPLVDVDGMPRPGTLAITGPASGRGSQARVALALAGLRAQQGRTTLLVLAEPANDLLPGVLATTRGVSDVLARDPDGTAGLLPAHVLTDGGHLLVCPPGTRSGEVFTRFSKAPFQQLLAQAAALADLVVVHAPPADRPEGQGVCATTDRSLVVLEEGCTRVAEAHAALGGLGSAGATALGAVLVRDPDTLPDPGHLAAAGRWEPVTGPADHTQQIALGDAGADLADLVGAGPRAVPSARTSAEES